MTRALLAALAALLLLTCPASAAGPATAIDAGPDPVSGDTTPSFRFSADEPDATFACRVVREGAEPPAFEPCTSPFTTTLPEGRYRFEVRATDAAGNEDATPATLDFVVDTTDVDTDIEAGPDGLTRNPTPSFTFGSETPGSTYECRLEGPRSPVADWAACSSPYETPSLATGDWVLHVRARDQRGRVDATPAKRSFAVDAIAPDTVITAPLPKTAVATRTPLITYTGRDDRTASPAFECRADNDRRGGSDSVAWAPCPAAGWKTPSLESGKHVIEVRAVDQAGNADPTPASVELSVSVCEQAVRFGLIEALGDCLTASGDGDVKEWTTTQPITINGMPLGGGGSRITLRGPSGGDGGNVSVAVGKVEILGIELWDGRLSWDLPKGERGEGLVESVDLTGGREELFGMKLSGTARLKMGRTDAGKYYSIAQLTVALPEVFKSGPDNEAGGITGDVAVRMTAEEGIRLDGAKIMVTNAYIGKVGVKSVCLSYVAAGGRAVAPCTPPTIGGRSGGSFLACGSNPDKDRWDGSAAVVLPTPSNLTLGLWAGVSGGRLAYAGASVENLGEMVPLGPGVFLNRVALGVCLDPPPFKIKGEAAVAFGPTFGDAGPGILVTGSIEYSDPYKGPKTYKLPFGRSITMDVDLPWYVDTRGRIEVFGYELASGYLVVWGSGLVDFGFRAGFDFGPASVHGRVDGWFIFDGSNRFNLEGEVEACIDDVACAGVTGVASSKGLGACIDLVLTTAGAGYTWRTKDLDIIGSGCSIGRWRERRPTAFAALRRAADDRGPLPGASWGVDVPKGVDAYAMRVDGVGGAPRVAFVGPDGRRIEAPEHGGGALDRQSHLLAQVEEQQHTAVVITRPAAGRWRIEPLPGSVPIAGVRDAAERPDLRIAGSVSKADRNGTRTLRYGAALAGDEQVTLVERGITSMKVLGTIKAGGRCGRHRPEVAEGQRRACGAIRFRPAFGNGGTRGIEAMIERDGMAMPHKTVAKFVAPKPKLPGRPRKLTVRRASRNRVVVEVTPSAGSARTNVRMALQDGRRLSFERAAKRRFRIVVPEVDRGHRVAVTARGIRKDLRYGKAATRTLKANRKAVPAPKGKTKTTKKKKTTKKAARRGARRT